MKNNDAARGRIDRCSWALMISCVLISVIISVITLTFYVTNLRDRKTSNDDPICVSCNDFDLVKSMDSGTTQQYESLEKHGEKGKGEMCCAYNKEQISALVQLISKKHTNGNTPQALGHRMGESLQKSIAFAQKSLSLQDERTKTNVPWRAGNKRYVMYIDPKHTDKRYELTQGVDLKQEGISIIHRGLYFVYKSINFLPDSNKPCKDIGFLTFKSFLVRNTSATQRSDLLRNEHTCCPDCIHNSETGFSGGIFQLEKGDTIQVEVTLPQVIHYSRDVTYVGLMMMGDQNQVIKH